MGLVGSRPFHASVAYSRGRCGRFSYRVAQSLIRGIMRLNLAVFCLGHYLPQNHLNLGIVVNHRHHRNQFLTLPLQHCPALHRAAEVRPIRSMSLTAGRHQSCRAAHRKHSHPFP